MLDVQDTRAARHAATKERILKEAWRLARRDGLQGFSLRDLARAVGMRAPSLYSYFDSKNALYDAMFAQGNREFLDFLQAPRDADDFEAWLRIGARRMFAFATSEPARYQLLFQRTIPGFEPSPASYGIAVEIVEAAKKRFADAGIDDPRAFDLWTAITAGLESQQLANDPGGDRYEQLVDDAVDMFLKHVGYRRKGKGRNR